MSTLKGKNLHYVGANSSIFSERVCVQESQHKLIKIVSLEKLAEKSTKCKHQMDVPQRENIFSKKRFFLSLSKGDHSNRKKIVFLVFKSLLIRNYT